MENVSHKLAELRKLATLMDSRFSFLGYKFGIDSLIGFVPGLGNLITTGIAGWIVYQGYLLNIPADLTKQMIINVLIDTLISSVPIAGNIGDFFFKANNKNLELLEDHFANL